MAGKGNQQAKPDRRHALLMAAYHAVAEKGFEGLRVRDVAATVGINGATLHHYFPSKELLIQAVAEYTIERLTQTMENLPGTPAEQIHAHIHGLYKVMREEPSLFTVLAELSLRAQRDPVLHYLVQQEGVWQDRLVAILEAGIAQGTWSDKLDPAAAAAAIIALLEGINDWVGVLPDRADLAIRQLETWLATS